MNISEKNVEIPVVNDTDSLPVILPKHAFDFWLARAAVLLTAGLNAFLINNLSALPWWLGSALEVALLIPLSIATASTQRRVRHAKLSQHWKVTVFEFTRSSAQHCKVYRYHRLSPVLRKSRRLQQPRRFHWREIEQPTLDQTNCRKVRF